MNAEVALYPASLSDPISAFHGLVFAEIATALPDGENKLGRHWTGHFVYGENETDMYPIEATLEFKHGLITGTMLDSRLEQTITPDEMLRNLPAGTPLHEEWARTGEAYPDLVVKYLTPRDSHIRGIMWGRRIRFKKTYNGKLLRFTILNDCEPTADELPTFPVSYRGELDVTGREIVGTWTYATPGFFGLRTNVVGSGRFRLVCRDEA